MEAQAVAKRDTARIGLGMKDKVQFKRKRAKVLPNSFLSCSSWKHTTSAPALVSPSHDTLRRRFCSQLCFRDCSSREKLVPKRKRKRSPVAAIFARAALDSISYGSC
ncbi:hypothetical protein ACFX2I_022533 [Malus domestica]